jgi:cellulose synthase/poly-beta-1,6-N-acetylglucosamine synthase-like glycosyltransferase
MIQPILLFASWIVYLYSLASALYLAVMAVAGKTSRQVVFGSNPVKKRMAVLIPAYREDAVIIDTVEKALAHNYPGEFFKVIVIADSLKPETIQVLNKTTAMVLQVNFELSSKAGSIRAALQVTDRDMFDVAVLLDADNIMTAGCLETINNAFHNGSLAVQCHRVAKNRNTPVALLDALSEEININLFRRGPAALGLSAAPMGSGMAFDFPLFKAIFAHNRMPGNPAEDREIEIQLMLKGIRMNFLENALVLDEKVANGRSFETQRTRWLEAQMNHVARFFNPDVQAAAKNGNYFNQLIRNLILPRLMFLMLFALVITLFVLQKLLQIKLVYPSMQAWALCITTYLAALFISVPAGFYRVATLKAILYLPVLIFRMGGALVKMKRNRKEFLHTNKTFTTK